MAELIRPNPRFVHLKVHSAYSLLEGALPISKLAKLAVEKNLPAIGLTDTNNLFGALEFSEKLWQSGVQPIAGCTLDIDFGDNRETQPSALRSLSNEPRTRPAGKIALLAMNADGFSNLMRLSKVLNFEPAPDEPAHVKIARLEELSNGLIVLTGGPEGPIDMALKNGQQDLAAERLKTLEKIFGNRLYVEVQRHNLPDEAAVEPALIDLAYARGVPLVATNEVYFAARSDYEAHDVLLCIAGGRYVIEDDRRRASPEHYLKTEDEMAALFADIPEALANSVEIAVRCAFRPLGKKPILPRFVQGDDSLSEIENFRLEAAELKRQAKKGLEERLAATGPAEGFTVDDYESRLAYEVDVITQMKFPGYFLIVADFIKWSKANDVPVGPGRGSGAGSLVAYALTITDLDPLRFGLLFERFLNPERVSMPDFDIDFCQEKRDRVIDYVQKKYGADRVAQIITHGKLQARAVLRDVGRVLQMPYGQVDRLCKLVPNNPANPVTLPQAIEAEPKLQEERDREPIVARLLEIAQKLEGLYRHASTHAAGMVIGDRPLDELVPLYRDPKSNFPITQYNWKLVEAAGLVKFDFLGLKTLTVLKKAVDLIEKGRGIKVDLAALPLDDRPTYEMLAKADTAGVFQLESTGMRESLKRLKPDRFEDIIAMVALYRPGPMDNIPTYIHRKHGEEEVDCLHDMLEGILKETYGVIIYQEQVIQIAQVMGGYTLGQADLLRRAMGKKDKAEMAKQQARFVEGATANGVKEKDAIYIFELVDKFAGYGFNKSHAAAYALVSYHTAYLKANFREEFFAASMTLDMGNTDKLAMFASEARKSGIRMLPPCVNQSAVDFGAEPASSDGAPGAIRYSLAALKNIGAGAVETIVNERDKGGPFTSLGDFAGRVDAKALNKRAIETMAKGGAFDALHGDRAAVAANADTIVASAQRRSADAAQGTTDLFGGGGMSSDLVLRSTEGWTPMERLSAEFEAIGFYLSGHPLDQYESVLKKLGVRRFSEFEVMAERGATAARLAGIVIAARERRSQKGNKFAFASFSDATGQFEAVIFSDTLAVSRDLLEPGKPVIVSVEAERDGETLKMRVQSLEALDKAAQSVPRNFTMVLDERQCAGAAGARLMDIGARLKPASRGGEIRLVLPLQDRGREVQFILPGRYEVSQQDAGKFEALPVVTEIVEF
ncbi:DNA polymerase III subunit alpha [Hyphomicrobium methylovorum]|uniref:DNA polymerase III subunit alpha n=1 Tax=Hyphomicrobium methylovorum TaxID=84 RepID=UPI0015E6E54D|nr:DNA polymerase III subunit alpha [Hyphomicrobium methylovorum]MBA2125130.1 DNA polymerase III subunit alpha [Hyphomicrobium methylovorum]